MINWTRILLNHHRHNRPARFYSLPRAMVRFSFVMTTENLTNPWLFTGTDFQGWVNISSTASETLLHFPRLMPNAATGKFQFQR